MKKSQKSVTRSLFIADLGKVAGGKPPVLTTLALGEEGDDEWNSAAPGPLDPTTLAIGEECVYPEP